jgi:hypothetical protein
LNVDWINKPKVTGLILTAVECDETHGIASFKIIFLLFAANLTICQQKLDLGFILDNSGSVGQRNFERMKSFVKDLTDFYKLGAEETRVSVMSYSNSANIHIAFSAYFSDKTRFDSAVDRISFTGGGTATAMALNKAYNYMFTSHYGARGSGKDLNCFSGVTRKAGEAKEMKVFCPLIKYCLACRPPATWTSKDLVIQVCPDKALF